jgi:hypothetical protein
MDFIKYFDFFTIKFHFYTNKQPKFRNIFGGIMNLIYLILCFIIFLGFSYEDLFKLNPISSKSEISNYEQKIVNLNEEKLWIPFRMVTYEEKFIDHRGLLYILPYFIEGKKNNVTGMDLKYNLLHYKLCNETSMKNRSNNYKIDVPLNELFCIEENDIKFGGSWNGNILNYIEIDLHLCKDGINYNSSDPRCTRMDDLLKYRNTSWLFEFYYPVVQFQPTNLETPLEVIYRSYFYRLSSNTNKVERLYLQEHILSDDRSLITKKYRNSSCWGMSTFYGDDYFFSENIDPIVKSTSSRIYSLDIYMDIGFVFYTREYKKLFMIFSNVFPLFRFILYFIKKFTEHIKMSLTKRNLIELIFENKKKSAKISIFKLGKMNKITNSQKNISLLMSKKDDSKEIIFDKSDNYRNNSLEKNKEQSHNNNSKSKSNISLNDEKVIDILNKKDLSKINSKNKLELNNEPLNVKESTPKTNPIIRKAKKIKFLFPFYYYFLDFYFDKLIRPEQFLCVSKRYFTVYNFMSHIYDISTHILLFKQFNLINNSLKTIYEENGFCPAHPFKKININDEELMDKMNKALKREKSILFSLNLN